MNHGKDGVRRFRLGAVEVAVIVLAISIGWWLVWQLVSAQYSAQMKANAEQAAASQATAEAVNGLKTQVAVMNDQILTLTTQFANVPQVIKTQAMIQAFQQDHERRIERLEEQRGVKVKGWTH